MKNIKYKVKISLVIGVLGLGLILGSCESYLTRVPEATIGADDPYKDFASFQGFTEEMYTCIVDPFLGDFNVADDAKLNITYNIGTYFDAGDMWGWYNNAQTIYSRYGVSNTNPTDIYQKGTWWNSWYGIRKANVGLANFDKLVSATQEEKDIIKGQLLFFRGYFYFMLMRDWGGMPYIEKMLTSDDKLTLPRLNYRETALKAAADLQAAAALLPLKWDDTETGKRTLGDNRQRISKVAALAFLGKDLLYAASPLMNRESTGSATFDAELCKKAADAFAQAINICDQTGVYTLQPWSTYQDMFFTVTTTRTLPGGVEVIMSPPVSTAQMTRWSNQFCLPALTTVGSNYGLTANYVKYWGMANGLPITDPVSGYNPTDPWVGRDPRFYKTVVVNGDQICISTAAGLDRFAQFFTGGRHRNTANNITGFICRKYWDNTINKWDVGYNNNYYQARVPQMRLSDVYLMYAESVLQGYGTAQSSFPGCITAEVAVNRVRNRATVPNLDPKFTASKDAFMGQIIIERAVELSMEGFRWNDLRRWLLAGDPKYLDKTELVFDENPVTHKPINILERLITTRVFPDRCNWLPLPINQVTLYPEFGQNPGW